MKKRVHLFLFAALAIIFFSKCNDQSTQSQDSKTDSAGVTKGWKIGVQMWTFNHFSFVTALDKVDSAGTKFIEAFAGQDLGGGMKGGFGPDMSAEDKAKLKQILQSKGISIVA